VLRRYLLHTRVTLGGGVAEAAIDGVPTPSLDDRAAALVAARELSVKPYYRRGPDHNIQTSTCSDHISTSSSIYMCAAETSLMPEQTNFC